MKEDSAPYKFSYKWKSVNPVKEDLKTDIVKNLYDRVVNVKQTYTLKEIQIQRRQPL